MHFWRSRTSLVSVRKTSSVLRGTGVTDGVTVVTRERHTPVDAEGQRDPERERKRKMKKE